MASSAQVQSLRQLQERLNKTIDHCVEVNQKHNGETSPELANTLVKVQDLATQVKIAATHPALQNIERAFEPVINLAIRIALDLNLFELIEGPTTVDELAKKTSADPVLLYRLLRCLRAFHYFDEGPQGHYKATELGKCLRIPNIRDMMKSWWDLLARSFHSMPPWFAKNGYKDMQDLSNNAWLNTYGDNFFDYLGKQPALQADFDSAMAVQEFMPPMALPQYPFSEIKQTLSKEPNAITLVDVGGGKGQYLTRIIQQNPDLPGRFIVQDLPETTDRVDKAKVPFEVMPHNFFESQPVRGAKFYHLRGIMHDWPDEACIRILKALHPAFKRGYSKLLIQTLVLTRSREMPVDLMNDLNMWTCCGVERDEEQFKELLGEAGFRIDRIIRPETGDWSIIEADLI